MPKISDCDRCRLYSQTSYLVCAVHPYGPVGDYCQDFESADLWEPEDPANYQDQNMEEFFWHPLFTGRCPECRYKFSRNKLPPARWYCPSCGWEDDTF